MARLIGEKPELNESELIMYQFVMEELPDYICASFAPMIKSKTGNLRAEFDMILFIPHMGVYIFEINNIVGFQYVDGEYFYEYRNGRTEPCVESKRGTWAREQKYVAKHYLKSKFNISPLVYEINCFPQMRKGFVNKETIPPDFDLNHIITADDLRDGLYFFRRLIDCSIYEQQLHGIDYYEDLTDKDAHDMFYFWETGPWLAPRPERPPFAFLSYNRLNAEISKEIQTVLEDRGVYTWRAPKDVPLGKHYLPEEMDAIEGCDAFIILLSLSAQKSDEVRKEFEKAIELNKPILPIWVEEVDDSEINDYYKEKLTEYQYRVMPILDSQVIYEIAETVKSIKKENDKKHMNQ
ncbi:MAG: toll/interleukin-1 receptor domain-containing protein [Lachnospiraceae bacterium]|nr:toll/interleukin-1 receptor domain-containing protein [Lachnospiraceae bacterium]